MSPMTASRVLAQPSQAGSARKRGVTMAVAASSTTIAMVAAKTLEDRASVLKHHCDLGGRGWVPASWAPLDDSEDSEKDDDDKDGDDDVQDVQGLALLGPLCAQTVQPAKRIHARTVPAAPSPGMVAARVRTP